MRVAQINDALPGEDLIGIDPELLQQVDAGWLQRLALFTGRTLSDTALTNEQQYRAGRLTLLGQAVTQGTVQGLELSVDLSAADPVLQLTPGYGIAASGQDVTLLRTLKTALSGIAVIDGQSGAYVADFKSYAAPGQPWSGILLLQAIVAAVPGSTVDTGSSNIIVSGNLDASCDQDPAEYAFGDSQIVDGARLVLATWPSAPTTLALPPLEPAATWRNRLAYTVFNAELALFPDDRLPWEYLGVPLALAAFDASSKLQFADRAAVVRMGGLSRRRYVAPPLAGQPGLLTVQPALAGARVRQFAEQLGEALTPSSPPGLIAGDFAFLPPSGVLPPYTMDFVHKVALWCPSNWTVTVAPIFLEELEGVLEAAVTAAPLDTSQNETIEVLIPLPDQVYDSDVLVTATLDPSFQHEVDAATLTRNIVLQHQKVILQETNALAAVLGQPAIDINAGLTSAEIAARDGPSVFLPDPAEAFGTVASSGAYLSTDLQRLQRVAAAPPYTITVGTTQLPLFNSDDWADLNTYGLQHFIDRINAKLDKANDLLDLAFLTSQTDIYRYRQNVLNTTDATRLAVSPILANIATGVTAAATAQNIRDYLASVDTSVTPPPTTTLPATTTTPPPTFTLRAGGAVLSSNLFRSTTAIASPALLNIGRTLPTSRTTLGTVLPVTAATTANATLIQTAAKGVGGATAFAPIAFGTSAQPASPVDITQQSPLIGAQLNLRTLTIAERLAQSPAQESLFYSLGNRVTILQLLAALEITIDDLPILADNVPAGTAPPVMADLRPAADPARTQLVLNLVNTPKITTSQSTSNPDEGTLFATGVHVLEQHTQLLRAVEGRIQQYRDFLTLCTAALDTIQNGYQSAQVLLTQLQNDLTQARQNLAFVLSMLADEQARVANVNATRANILQNFVQFVAFARPRTLTSATDAPSRQLLPGNVASPVPACLQQSVAVPPELREIVALLREAPISWFPLLGLEIGRLERPSLLQDLATSSQARATLQLQLPLHISSAASATGIYAPAISTLYSSAQETFRTFQAQRAALQTPQLANQSWTAQLSVLQNTVAVADLLASEAVHAEIVNATSRSLQQISTVATCLYTRVGQALPIDRLTWAEFLRNNASVALRSLAVLPGWNSQNYVDRQQMQLLVDWLFQQIDPTNQTAVALMGDVVAVAILLASQAPVDAIIAGAVALRTTPVVGGPIRLTLPSDRVAHGMYVQLYSAGVMTARAVVSDLDTTGVTATITDVYNPNVALEANDVAHFTALNPDAIVYRAFSA
jgi:hypothetical protein